MQNVSFWDWLSHSVQLPWSPSKLLHVSRVCSFFTVESYSMVWTYHILPLKDLWMVSSLGPLWIKLRTLMYKCLHKSKFHFSEIHAQEYNFRVIRSFLVLEKNCQTIFPSGYTILYSHRQRMNDPALLLSCQHLVLSLFILAILIGTMISHCDFNVHFSNGLWCWTFFMYLLAWVQGTTLFAFSK